MPVTRQEFLAAISTVALALAERFNIGTVEDVRPDPAPTPTPAPELPEYVSPAGPTGTVQDVPDLTLDPSTVAPLAAFGNGKPVDGLAWFGASLGSGNSGTGWPDFPKHIAPVIALGVKAIRFPFKRDFCLMPDGSVNLWVLNKIIGISKDCMKAGVAVAWDDHKYGYFTDPGITAFWSMFAPLLENGTGKPDSKYPHTEKGIGGPNPLFMIELQNEPGKGSKDWALWTQPLTATIRAIRNAGYKGYIGAGWGDWNNASQAVRAADEIQKAGGLTSIDPLNRTIYTMHDYWGKHSDPAKTRNDQSEWVDGMIDMSKRYGPAVEAFRKIGGKLIVSEIGGGITPEGPMPPFEGAGKDGKQLQEDYFAFAKANRDTLLGSWFWAGGKINETYRHKIVTKAADGSVNEHTQSLMSGLWV